MASPAVRSCAVCTIRHSGNHGVQDDAGARVRGIKIVAKAKTPRRVLTPLEKAEAKVKREAAELELLAHIRAYKLPEPEREYKFDSSRGWRFDFAWPMLHIAAEVEGGIYTNGRHNRGSGYKEDCVKYNTAQSQGWCVLRFTSDMVKSGEAIIFLEGVIKRWQTKQLRSKTQ